jgi:hypothetical protein
MAIAAVATANAPTPIHVSRESRTRRGLCRHVGGLSFPKRDEDDAAEREQPVREHGRLLRRNGTRCREHDAVMSEGQQRVRPTRGAPGGYARLGLPRCSEKNRVIVS